MERIIYTCITNNYDTLRPIKAPDGWRAICFTDYIGASWDVDGWEISKHPMGSLNAREVKLNPHYFLPPHHRSIWIDGNLEYRGDWYDYDLPGFTVMKHPDRFCVYD